MKIKKFHIYLADLNPPRGTEAGKVRPVVVVQTDLLNDVHSSTIICPITTNLTKEAEPLRINLSVNETGLKTPSDIMVDQIRAIDNRRFKRQLGKISRLHQDQLLENLQVLLLE